MKYRRRIYYNAAQRAEIWDRWQRGESMSSIGRVFDRQSSSVFSVISPTGGIRPPDRTRNKRALVLGEREEISRGLSTGRSLRSIAFQLGRAPSTISREVRAQWRPRCVSGGNFGTGGLGSGPAPESMQAGLPPGVGPRSIRKAAPQMVTRTDCGLAQTQLSGRGAKTGVA